MIELESGPYAAGPLLIEVQGIMDLNLARACARKLAALMAAKGALPSEASIEDAAGDATLALVRARNSGLLVNRPLVAWKAAVQSMSRSLANERDIEDGRHAAEAWLWPGPDGEPDEQNRCRLLPKRIEVWVGKAKTSPARAKRRALAEKIASAASFLLAGYSINEAAEAAGFRPSGRTSAAARLWDAVRRLSTD